MASIALGFTRPEGREPALCASTFPAPCIRANASAIWLRFEFSTQTKMTRFTGKPPSGAQRPDHSSPVLARNGTPARRPTPPAPAQRAGPRPQHGGRRVPPRVARRCRRIIGFNFAGTLAVDSLGMGLAAVGMLNPLFAAFIHVSSELAFILNSARLLPGVSKRR